MKDSIKVGISFGLTSGIITTLGLLVGLYFTTQSKVAVIGGILTIAIADALSDALGIHMSQETRGNVMEKEIWESTLATFAGKFFFASNFVVPLLLFPLRTAVIISVLWALILLGVGNFFIADHKKTAKLSFVFKHLIVAIVVVIISLLVGEMIRSLFK